MMKKIIPLSFLIILVVGTHLSFATEEPTPVHVKVAVSIFILSTPCDIVELINMYTGQEV